MAGPIILILMKSEDDTDPLEVPFLSAYDIQQQFAALEKQADANNALIIATVVMKKLPPEEEAEDKPDGE